MLGWAGSIIECSGIEERHFYIQSAVYIETILSDLRRTNRVNEKGMYEVQSIPAYRERSSVGERPHCREIKPNKDGIHGISNPKRGSFWLVMTSEIDRMGISISSVFVER